MNVSNITTLTQAGGRVTCKNAYLGPHIPRFCYISFFEIGIFGYLSLRSACNYHGSADVGRPKAARKIAATNHKYERPAAWGTTGLP